jgi:tetratricopeptide (TPR) repeat protein
VIGSLIGGHIRILGALGQGGMGNVYAGIDERLGRQVAVKTIRLDRTANGRVRFLREARALSALDHPNICRLFEYIESPQGDFLVLELIEGVTLGRAIEHGMSRARKLEVASSILEALAAAHRKGIAHRDLKPDNVMISAQGAVKVLDFGIAELETSGDPDASEGAVVPIDDASTLLYPIAGITASSRPLRIVAGTPLYMSPEQARGADVTVATDLYSFGLLLQTLLTEEPPHDRSVGREILLQRAARGESLPMSGQPRDVTSLVAALKSVAPEERPTATEACATIESILDKPKRRIRAAAAAVASVLLLAGGAKYVFDITAARDAADFRRGQAEDLVRFIVGDLRGRLEPVGRLDALDGAASRALAYFASIPPEEMTGDDLHYNALALAQLGQARDQEGKLRQAIQLFLQSVRFGSAAVQRDSSKDQWQMTLSNAHFWLGDALRRERDVDGALEHFGAYFAISQRLAQRHPNDPKYQAEVSYAHGNLGAAYEAGGDIPRARSEFRIALDLDRRRLHRDPKNEQWQADLANSANRLGVVLQKTGDFTGARRAFDEDLEARRRLAQAAPDDVRRQRRLAASLAYAGSLHQSTGDVGQALACYREEAALSAALAAQDPSNADARRNRDVARVRLAALLDPAAGLPLAEAAANDLRELARNDARAAWRRDLAATLVRLAAIRLRVGALARARADAEEALRSSEALVAERPKDVQYVRILCDALMTAAALDETQGRLPSALQRRTRAADVANTIPDDPSIAALRIRALFALGRAQEAAPMAQKLLAGGYREAEFASVVAHSRPTRSPPGRSPL